LASTDNEEDPVDVEEDKSPVCPGDDKTSDDEDEDGSQSDDSRPVKKPKTNTMLVELMNWRIGKEVSCMQKNIIDW